MIIENEYRSHYCGKLDTTNVGEEVKLSGWMHSIRDHGGLVFIDLRDQFGFLKLLLINKVIFKKIENLRLESVISIKGKVILRSKETINDKIQTGKIEVIVDTLNIISKSKILPIQIAGDENYNDELRLKNRFLDLRRERLKKYFIEERNYSIY